MPVAPSGEIDKRLRPVVVAAAGVGTVLVQGRDDPAVLTGVELAESIERQHQIAFGNLQPRLEAPRVLDLVDIDLHGARRGPQGRRGIVHVIPAGCIVEPTDHVDARRREDEVAVVQIVLLRGEHRHRRAGLLAWIRRLLSGHRSEHDDSDDHECSAHQPLRSRHRRLDPITPTPCSYTSRPPRSAVCWSPATPTSEAISSTKR